MSKHASDEKTNRQITNPTVDEILELDCGDAIAVRSIHQDIERIVAGKLSTEPDSRSEIDEELDELDLASIIGINADVWWNITDDEIEDKSHRLKDRPPYRPYPGEPLRDAPPCSLACDDDGSVTVIIPTPIYRRSQIYYYAPDSAGTVVELDTGAVVTPTTLLPEECDPFSEFSY